VSEQGQHLQYRAMHDWFARAVPAHSHRADCRWAQALPDVVRHTCAVTRMLRWYQQGLDVQALLPHLSVYLVTSTRRRVIGTSRQCRSS